MYLGTFLKYLLQEIGGGEGSNGNVLALCLHDGVRSCARNLALVNRGVGEVGREFATGVRSCRVGKRGQGDKGGGEHIGEDF